MSDDFTDIIGDTKLITCETPATNPGTSMTPRDQGRQNALFAWNQMSNHVRNFFFISFIILPWKVGETALYSWIKMSNFLPIPRVTSRHTTAARSRAHFPLARKLSNCPWTLANGKNLWLLTSPCQCPSLNMIGRPHLLMARRSSFLVFPWNLKGFQLENLMCIYNVIWRKRMVQSILRYTCRILSFIKKFPPKFPPFSRATFTPV